MVDGTIGGVPTARLFHDGLPAQGGRWALIRCEYSAITPGDWLFQVEDGSGTLEPGGVFLTNDELRELMHATTMALAADLAMRPEHLAEVLEMPEPGRRAARLFRFVRGGK